MASLLEALGGTLEGWRRYGSILEASLVTPGLLLDTPGLFLETLEDFLGDCRRPPGHSGRLAQPSWRHLGDSIVEAPRGCHMVSR